jgi:hypothetical protein
MGADSVQIIRHPHLLRFIHYSTTTLKTGIRFSTNFQKLTKNNPVCKINHLKSMS